MMSVCTVAAARTEWRRRWAGRAVVDSVRVWAESVSWIDSASVRPTRSRKPRVQYGLAPCVGYDNW